MANKNINQNIELSFLANEYKITKCYFKKHYNDGKSKVFTMKRHFHVFYELHLTEKGHVSYDVQGVHYTVHPGEILLIPPKLAHQLLERSEDHISYHLTFCFPEVTTMGKDKIYFFKSDAPFVKTLKLVEEKINSTGFNQLEVGGLTFSAISSLPSFKEMFYEQSLAIRPADNDRRLEMAKQFIHDNIMSNPAPDDVAAYCYLGQKQLSRIFEKGEGMSVKEYITKERIKKIEYFVSQKDMTAKEVAFTMSFGNEYYFNTFFKKHFGVSPGEYKRILKL